MEARTGRLTKEPLPTWASVSLGVCLVLMAGIALWPPYEVFGTGLGPVDSIRKSVFRRPEPGTGVLRLRFGRLLREEGAVLVVAIAVLVQARRSRRAGTR